MRILTSTLNLAWSKASLRRFYFNSTSNELFISQVGCRTKWDIWSDGDKPCCTSVEQYRWPFAIYKPLTMNSAGDTIRYSTSWEIPTQMKSVRLPAAQSRASTGSTVSWENRIHQRSNQTTSCSPSGPSPTRPLLRRRSWSTRSRPWSRSLEAPSVSFLDSHSSPSGTLWATWENIVAQNEWPGFAANPFDKFHFKIVKCTDIILNCCFKLPERSLKRTGPLDKIRWCITKLGIFN